MITCPECGQEAPDDAKFCDRCGQGLSKAASSTAQSSPTRPTPLTAGASLKGGIEIVALTGQTSIENRYSAKRVRDGKTESIALRERLAPHREEEAVDEAPVVETPKPPPPPAEDPNGPSAKTAELRPPPARKPTGPHRHPHLPTPRVRNRRRRRVRMRRVKAYSPQSKRTQVLRRSRWPRPPRTHRQMKRAKRRKQPS